jgi:uncharacterized membrane protein YhaH (DUF805 family)
MEISSGPTFFWNFLVRPLLRRAFVTVIVPLLALAVSLVTTWMGMAVLRRLRDVLLAALWWVFFVATVLLMTTFFLSRTTEHPEYVDLLMQGVESAWVRAQTLNWTQVMGG